MEIKVKCLLCGRRMDPVSPKRMVGPPHNCVGGFRKRGLKWRKVEVPTDEDFKDARPMEEVWPELMEMAKNNPPPTYPNSWYNEDGDMLEVYLAGDIHHAKRIDNLLTVLISNEPENEGKIVGYHIKSISRIMARIDADIPLLTMPRMD